MKKQKMRRGGRRESRESGGARKTCRGCLALLAGIVVSVGGCRGAETAGSADTGESAQQAGMADTAEWETKTLYHDFGEADILTASDMHFLSPSLTDHGAYFTQLIGNSDGKTMEYSDELADAFVDTVKQEKPDALVLTGDLTFNGARKSHEDFARKLEEIREAGIPVLVLSGNHDLENSNAASFHGDSFTRVDSITAKEFEEIYRDFGFSGALSKDTASSSYVYGLKPGLRLLMLDVNGVEDVCHVPESTLSWIEEELRDAQEAGCLVLSFSHQNLLQHSMFVSGYVIDNSDEVLSLYREYGVPANFTGHLHIQHIGEEEGFFEIATSALSISPEHYARIRVTPESLSYDTASVDVASWAERTGSDNPDLVDFGAYSEAFFLDTCRRQAMERLSDVEDEDLKKRMAEYFAERNYAYFSGEAMGEGEQEADTQEDREVLSAWEKTESFTGEYLVSLEEERRPDQNHLLVRFTR